jgi:hypothetical protein
MGMATRPFLNFFYPSIKLLEKLYKALMFNYGASVTKNLGGNSQNIQTQSLTKFWSQFEW